MNEKNIVSDSINDTITYPLILRMQLMIIRLLTLHALFI